MTRTLELLDARIPAWNLDELLVRSCPICSAAGEERFRRPDQLLVRGCNACGTWFVSPAPDESALARFYASYASTHKGARRQTDAELAAAFRAQSPESSLVLTELAATIRLSDARLLDVGCSRGAFLCCAQRLGARVQGVDLDEESVRFAREQLSLEVNVGTIFDLPSDQSFDAITMLDFVEHPLDIRATLKRATQLLAPRGVLALWTPNGSEFAHTEAPLALRVDLEHMQYFSTASIAWIARDLELVTVHLETCGQPDFSLAKPASRLPPVQKLGTIVRDLARRTGLADLRRRLLKHQPFEERRGNYALLALLQKP